MEKAEAMAKLEVLAGLAKIEELEKRVAELQDRAIPEEAMQPGNVVLVPGPYIQDLIDVRAAALHVCEAMRVMAAIPEGSDMMGLDQAVGNAIGQLGAVFNRQAQRVLGHLAGPGGRVH